MQKLKLNILNEVILKEREKIFGVWNFLSSKQVEFRYFVYIYVYTYLLYKFMQLMWRGSYVNEMYQWKIILIILIEYEEIKFYLVKVKGRFIRIRIQDKDRNRKCV